MGYRKTKTLIKLEILLSNAHEKEISELKKKFGNKWGERILRKSSSRKRKS